MTNTTPATKPSWAPDDPYFLRDRIPDASLTECADAVLSAMDYSRIPGATPEQIQAAAVGEIRWNRQAQERMSS